MRLTLLATKTLTGSTRSMAPPRSSSIQRISLKQADWSTKKGQTRQLAKMVPLPSHLVSVTAQRRLKRTKRTRVDQVAPRKIKHNLQRTKKLQQLSLRKVKKAWSYQMQRTLTWAASHHQKTLMQWRILPRKSWSRSMKSTLTILKWQLRNLTNFWLAYQLSKQPTL